VQCHVPGEVVTVRRTVCSACGGGGLDTFLDLGMSPIADAYTETSDRDVPMYPLELAVCEDCHLVQLLEVLDSETLFGTGYSFYTSASPPLSIYLGRYAKTVLQQYGDLARRFTVEIGCNDGDLLRHFDAAGCPTLGIDPATGPVDAARRRGLTVAATTFTAQAAQEMISQGRPQPGLIIANHVLAHVADVKDFLSGIATLLADDGVAIIEVQYLPDMLLNNSFDLVYHEHRNFFSLTSLENAAQSVDLQVVDAQLTSRQGGSLRVVLGKGAQQTSGYVSVLRKSEEWLQDWSAYSGFQGRAERVATRLYGHLLNDNLGGGPIVGYGAPAKATTLLNFCGIGDDILDYVIDTTVAKQGRYIPGTGLEILAPSSPLLVDTFLLLAWNYAATIMRQEQEFLARGGRWIIPFPAPMVI